MIGSQMSEKKGSSESMSEGFSVVIKPNSKAITSVEQKLLFSDNCFFSESLPALHDLKAASNLSAIFDECHNYIYANEGFLKDKIFHEMVKLIVMKMHDERTTLETAQFGIVAQEYQEILDGRSGDFGQRIQTLYEAVKEQYPALLTDEKLKLQPQTLAYLVGRLQFISFSKTPGDVKGEAFQAFTYRHQRGGRGEFFTPHPIVRLAVEMLAPQPHEKVLDPACGSGGFLIEAISYLTRSSQFDKAAYVQNNVRGIEFNPDVALSASIRLAFEGGSGKEVACANALLANTALNETYDLILTNPPFGSKGKVEDRNILKSYSLARKWEHSGESQWQPTNTLLAGQSPDILFMEKCLNLLRPGGRMAIVLPDGLLQNISSSHIRFWTRQQAQVLGVVSIPQEAFIPYGTGIKTSLLLLQKLPAPANASCFMARIEKIGYDVKGQTVYKRDPSGLLIRGANNHYVLDDDVDEIASCFHDFRMGNFQSHGDKVFTVSRPSLNSRIDVEHYQPGDQQVLDYLKSKGAKPLGEIADILSETAAFRVANDSEIRYIAISDVDYRTMQVVSQQIIKSHEAPSRATYRVCINDIITATSGASTGTRRQATALVTEEEAGAICSNGFAVIRNVHGVNPYFLLAYMRSDYYLRQVKRLMTGHAIPSISQEDLSKVLVPIPTPEQQERIARSVRKLQNLRREATKSGEKLAMEADELICNL